MKFPRLTRLDDGRLFVIATGWLADDPTDPTIDKRTCFIIESITEGQSWGQPRAFHTGAERPEPVSLGGGRIVVVPNDDAGFLCSSQDNGVTWAEKAPFPHVLPDGRESFRHGTLLVEEGGSTVSGIFAAMDADDSHPSGWAAQAMIRTSRDCGQTWNEGIFLPREWNASEGALARAPDGALVVSLRTDRAPGLPDFCDHWRRLATARSVDNGLTWTDYQVHFDFGKVGITSRSRTVRLGARKKELSVGPQVHSGLVVLRDGRLLMTYAARIGEVAGEMYHGIVSRTKSCAFAAALTGCNVVSSCVVRRPFCRGTMAGRGTGTGGSSSTAGLCARTCTARRPSSSQTVASLQSLRTTPTRRGAKGAGAQRTSG